MFLHVPHESLTQIETAVELMVRLPKLRRVFKRWLKPGSINTVAAGNGSGIERKKKNEEKLRIAEDERRRREHEAEKNDRGEPVSDAASGEPQCGLHDGSRIQCGSERAELSLSHPVSGARPLGERN